MSRKRRDWTSHKYDSETYVDESMRVGVAFLLPEQMIDKLISLYTVVKTQQETVIPKEVFFYLYANMFDEHEESFEDMKRYETTIDYLLSRCNTDE